MTTSDHAAIPPDYAPAQHPAQHPVPPVPRPGPVETCVPGPVEPSFVLLGRDPQAPALVELWADQRAELEDCPDKVRAAREIADRMVAFKRANPGLGVPTASVPIQPRETSQYRWEVGFRNIVSYVRGPRQPFDIPEIVEEVRKMVALQRDLRVDDAVTEEGLRQASQVMGWSARECTSVPRLDGSWHHPVKITADAESLAAFINRTLAHRGPRVEYRDVDLQLLKRGLAFVEAYRETYFGDCPESMAVHDPGGGPPSQGSSFDVESWNLLGMLRKALDHAHEDTARRKIAAEADVGGSCPVAPSAEPGAEPTQPYGWVYVWTDDDADGGARVQHFSRMRPDLDNPYVSDVAPVWTSPPITPEPPRTVSIDASLLRRVAARSRSLIDAAPDLSILAALLEELRHHLPAEQA